MLLLPFSSFSTLTVPHTLLTKGALIDLIDQYISHFSNHLLMMQQMKKFIVILFADCALLQQLNASMPTIINLKNIFAIKQNQICSNLSRYSGKTMQYFKAYKRMIEYTLDVQSFIYCIHCEQCTYTEQF